ncbi:hypothetical protein [Candidatus Nanohalobium constans]|uniref:Uncharacterized protein n=1 Tax=Candidatus Nanohalobium constans TaxID=2565781 RepID=A0A5Q0UG03_9ARCH|nr:hypothetical protein [Candidatus Nanohalobium constans]QGA80331.1 hypothetical protein LC1Nh_0430 [Candidatus Nanohalobium constans]
MNIGEGTSGDLEITSSDTWYTISVPAGETWEFTTVGLSSGNRKGNAQNNHIKVGYEDSNGNNYVLVDPTDDMTPPVGASQFENNHSQSKTIPIDGDTMNGLSVRSSIGGYTLVWSAVRVS